MKEIELKVIPISHDITFDIFDNGIGKLSQIIINAYIKKVDDIFIASLRNNADPPIRGEITKRKIRYRGIELHKTDVGNFTFQQQLFQRGRPISPVISFYTEIK